MREMSVTTPVLEVIRAAAGQLSPSERRVAEVVARDPEAVAFGTVAEVAKKAGTSGPTVVRLADRLGYAGFVGLQARVRDELAHRLRPAVQRIRSQPGGPLVERVLEAELDNVRHTLGALDDGRFERAVELLGDADRRLWVLASEQTRALGLQLANELALLRDGVGVLGGSEFGVVTRLAALSKGDVVVVIDLRRHERWLVSAAALAARRGATRIAVTDSELSPLCDGAACALVVSAAAAGPFDSQVGMLALFNALVGGVAARHRRRVARRIEALERIWGESGVLLEG